MDLVNYFGSDNKDPKQQTLDQQAGNLIFFDALPIAPPVLKVEIMTPHMGDYYAKGIKEAGKANTIPADWHSPNPIPLLAVESISLLFCIAPRNSKIDANELEQLKTALQNALANMGAGAKTQTGFGRLIFDDSSEAYRLFRNELMKLKKQASIASKTLEDFLLDEVAEQIKVVSASKNPSTEKNLYVKFRELYDKQIKNKTFTQEHFIKLKDLMLCAEKFGISKVDQVMKKIARDLL
jgi:CRISPR-associated protein Cmr6